MSSPPVRQRAVCQAAQNTAASPDAEIKNFDEVASTRSSLLPAITQIAKPFRGLEGGANVSPART